MVSIIATPEKEELEFFDFHVWYIKIVPELNLASIYDKASVCFKIKNYTIAKYS